MRALYFAQGTKLLLVRASRCRFTKYELHDAFHNRVMNAFSLLAANRRAQQAVHLLAMFCVTSLASIELHSYETRNSKNQ